MSILITALREHLKISFGTISFLLKVHKSSLVSAAAGRRPLAMKDRGLKRKLIELAGKLLSEPQPGAEQALAAVLKVAEVNRTKREERLNHHLAYWRIRYQTLEKHFQKQLEEIAGLMHLQQVLENDAEHGAFKDDLKLITDLAIRKSGSVTVQSRHTIMLKIKRLESELELLQAGTMNG